MMHPAHKEVKDKRKQSFQLRIADGITAFAGSMRFVYIHAIIFAVWCATGLFGHDKFPFNFLTMTVSLEAIFLSTFVMIGQNRQSDFAQAKADHDFKEQELELHTNTQLTTEVHQLVQDIHKVVIMAKPQPKAPVKKAPAVRPDPKKAPAKKPVKKG